MSAADRRAVLRYAAAAMLLPALSAPLRAAAEGLRFAPPAGPMLYTRRLERGLAGGASLTVRRGFEVRFRREAGGYLVDGRQVEVEVAAPAALDAFVGIEREREERGLFPLLLAEDGTIAGSAAAASAAGLDAAVREALAAFETQPLAPGERAELVRFVTALHDSAGRLVTELPRDLFAPADTPRVEVREIALPGGNSGVVTATFSAMRDPATGLMREAWREVVTEVDGDRRRTLETWRLDPLA